MQKVLFSKDLISILMQGENLLNRADILVYTAATTEDILKTHIEETLNLIVTSLDLPGTVSESIFEIIWQSQHLKEVRVIMICEDDVLHRARCKHCGAHAILPIPVDPGLLQEKVRQFLEVALRQAYRVLLRVSIDGKFNDRHFLCHTENISTTGALISSELDLSPGNRISCSFYLPDGTKVETQGEVMRVLKQAGSNETLYGIRYTNIPSESKAKIEAYVKKDRM
ncbi:MAG: PilZ domain-containing protein [Nitrospirae bacterium]|nr:PilZ domain-containing protein [Nitrospirota bacterium]